MMIIKAIAMVLTAEERMYLLSGLNYAENLTYNEYVQHAGRSLSAHSRLIIKLYWYHQLQQAISELEDDNL